MEEASVGVGLGRDVAEVAVSVAGVAAVRAGDVLVLGVEEEVGVAVVAVVGVAVVGVAVSAVEDVEID
jgi:hypothetical protein